jgi:hypothetical protein
MIEMELIGLCLAPLSGTSREKLVELACEIRDWEMVFNLATLRMSSPLVYRRLLETGMADNLPDRILAYFEDVYQRQAAVNALRLRRGLEISEALWDTGARPLFFKGASLLLHGVYPDLGQRLMSDVDMLSRREWRPLVEEAFSRSGGWTREDDQLMQEWEVAVWSDDIGGMVEVHWDLQPHNGAPAGAAEARLFRNAVEVSHRGKKGLVPSLEDCFVQAALHATSHHYFDSTYLYPGVADLCHLCSVMEGADWERVVSDLKAERMLEHGMVAVQLGVAMTRYEPLQLALARLEELNPGLSDICSPLSGSLLKIIRKPWAFESFYERRALAPKSAGEWGSYIYYAISRRLRAFGKASIKGKEDAVPINTGPGLRGRLSDLEYLKYLCELYRFDRKTGFRVYFGPDRDGC